MHTYTKRGTEYHTTLDDGRHRSIPDDHSNMDYARLLEEVAAGEAEVRDDRGALVDMSLAIAEHAARK
jgi:hypothetical protein